MQSHLIFSFITKGKLVIFFALLFLLTACSGCGKRERETFTETGYGTDRGNAVSESGNESATTAESTADSADQICVFVCGAVEEEGVYYLPERSRVIDAVNAAGGYREDADRVYVNQAEFVYDAERVDIPTLEEALELREGESSIIGGADNRTGQRNDGLININTASKDELMQIPGIGESKADRIIAYRENHGRFGSAEELQNVSGIGSGIYEGLKDYITVE